MQTTHSHSWQIYIIRKGRQYFCNKKKAFFSQQPWATAILCDLLWLPTFHVPSLQPRYAGRANVPVAISKMMPAEMQCLCMLHRVERRRERGKIAEEKFKYLWGGQCIRIAPNAIENGRIVAVHVVDGVHQHSVCNRSRHCHLHKM